jgi:hypothetical protein
LVGGSSLTPSNPAAVTARRSQIDRELDRHYAGASAWRSDPAILRMRDASAADEARRAAAIAVAEMRHELDWKTRAGWIDPDEARRLRAALDEHERDTMTARSPRPVVTAPPGQIVRYSSMDGRQHYGHVGDY